MKPKQMNGKYWAYYAPDGYLQIRTVAPTKKISRAELASDFSDITWKDYEDQGFVLLKVDLSIQPVCNEG